MSTSHKHSYPTSSESPTAIAAGDALGRVLFKELTASHGRVPLLVRFHDLVERPFLEELLKHTKGNKSQAADMMGLNRSTLRKLCRRYRIVP